MMKKVVIEDAGDSRFLEKQFAEKSDFMQENDRIFGMVVITDAGDSELAIGPDDHSASVARCEQLAAST